MTQDNAQNAALNAILGMMGDAERNAFLGQLANNLLGIRPRRSRGAARLLAGNSRAKPPEDYAPTAHVLPAEREGSLEVHTGHRPGDAMLSVLRTASKANGVRYSIGGRCYYGSPVPIGGLLLALQEAGYEIETHDDRQSGLAAVAKEPAPKTTTTAPKAAESADAGAAMRALRARLGLE